MTAGNITLYKAFRRQTIRQENARYTPEERVFQSQRLVKLLTAHPRFQQAAIVLLYAPLPDEVDISPLLAAPPAGKTLFLPRVAGMELTIHIYNGVSSLTRNPPYGLLEPTTPTFARLEAIELAVVPGMAFDHCGHRLGRGKGYYDRLLAAPTMSATYRLGICFPFQMCGQLPTLPHDIPMNEVIY